MHKLVVRPKILCKLQLRFNKDFYKFYILTTLHFIPKEICKYAVINVSGMSSANWVLSVLYVEKNQNKILHNILRSLTSRFRQIAFLMTCQQHKVRNVFHSQPNILSL